MPAIEESWEPYAHALGFPNEREMLRGLYEEEGFSINQISRILGPAAWTVRRRLIMNDIELRERGGPNRTGKRRLLEVSDEELFTNTPPKLAEKYQVHLSTVFAERRLRRCNTASFVPQDGSTSLPSNQDAT